MAYTWATNTLVGIEGFGNGCAAANSTGKVAYIGSENMNMDNYLYLSTNHGTNWTKYTDLGKKWQGIATSNNGNYLVGWTDTVGGDNSNTVYLSTNFGTTWSSITNLPAAPNPSIVKLAVNSSGHMLALLNSNSPTNNSYFYKSTNLGVSWSVTTLPSIYLIDIDCDSTLTTMIAKTGYPSTVLYTSANGGTSWSTATLWGAGGDIMTVAVSKYATNVLAAGGQTSGFVRGLYVSTDTGATWQAKVWPGSSNINGDGFTIAHTGVCFAGQQNSPLRMSTDFGATWANQGSGTYPQGLSVSDDFSAVYSSYSSTTFQYGYGDAIGGDAPGIPTEVTGVVTVPNTGGTITLTEDMTVTATGELTLDIAEVGNLAGGKTITVQPGGKIKLTTGQQITVRAGTLYKLV